MSSFAEIMATQQQLATAIEQVWTNFKKDSSDRKTPDYLQRRVELLDKYWVEFEQNHSKLSEFGEDSPYFENNDYERVRERYGSIRASISDFKQPTTSERPASSVLKAATFKPTTIGKPTDFQQPPAAPRSADIYQPLASSRGTASKTDDMLKKQQSNFKAFHRCVTNIDIDSVSEKWEFDDILRTLQSRWATIDALHWELDSELDESNQKYEEAFSSYEREYTRIKKEINKKMWSLAHREKATPQMEIPTFNGNYNSWISFKDLFTEIIHNNTSMSSAQKMQYLKTKIRGEAERLIHHLSVSSDNYMTCWEILNQRYNNKKLLFTSQINLLLNLPAVQQQSLNHIKRMHDTTIECLNAIKNLGVDISSWDPLIVHILSQKLDTESFTDYVESMKQPRELPVLKEFLDFLEMKFTTLESSSRKKQDNNLSPKNQGNFKHNQFYKTTFNKNTALSSSVTTQQPNNKVGQGTTRFRCLLCNSNEHGIYFCQKFLDMTSFNKRKTVTKLNLCQNCLNYHPGKSCQSDHRCRECNKGHNSLLHEAFTQSGNVTTETAAGAGSASGAHVNSGKNVKSSSHVSLPNEPIEILLPTAIIKIQSADGSYHTMRALLDQGSQVSLITEHAAQLLRLPRKRCMGVISGVGDKESSCKGMLNVKCMSVTSDFTFETEVLIMKNLIKNLPTCSFSKPEWSYLDNIILADPEFYVNRPIDILLGADVYSIILLDGVCRVNSTLPTAQQTALGWILSGNVKTFQCNIVLHNLDEIQRFWEIEDISEPSNVSSEDQRCIDYYETTTIRQEDGKYKVRLPLKPNHQDNLGESKHKAIGQFYSLEQKLNKQPEIAQDYKTFINEYLELGHMKPATASDSAIQCYLPHHCVTRLESSTTKLRVVFNASAKTSSGYSLNDVMCRGPNLQQDLQSLIIKWRQYQFAFTADIEKMFRQIWLDDQDQQLQRIIWRNHESQKLKVYQLATVTYGTKAAPFLAMMTLKQLASDEKANYQDSSASKHSIEAAVKLKQDMISLLKSGGFNLRKWKSNTAELLDCVSVEENNHDVFDFKQAESTKTLGLGWNSKNDHFTFQSKINNSSTRPSKRSLLSDISKLFDPLGWLSPITTKLKILFQDIWKTNIQWDEQVPVEVCEEWMKIKADIDAIGDCLVPRWLGTGKQECIELHGFCDASTKAYACVIYCRINRENRQSVTLVAGKAKLVPLNKVISLPRLELCGAVLLSKLMDKVKSCLDSHDIKIHGWVDSMAVLGWLHGDADRWKPFVANRVNQITAVMPSDCWRYVKSKENPADCASRGNTATELKQHQLWWQGPDWLLTYKPMNDKNEIQYTTDEEVKKIKSVNVVQLNKTESIINDLLTRNSSLTKPIKILGWIMRFIKRNHHQDHLSCEELRQSREMIIKAIQLEEFTDEISCLKANKSVNNKSKLLEFNPFLDENGVLRVGGRLRHANIDQETKHPAIIPSNTRLADLLIDEAHELTFHGGARLTTAFLRKKYWLIGGIRATKKRLRLCVKCKKHNPDQQYQLMGDLPPSRSNPSRPFYHTGVDYTGHVLIKANKGRGIKTTKGYVAVFVCMATKAVHLELVSDLTASAFLSALRRMAARRGVPGHIYSDQGRNFIGANKVLQQELETLRTTINQHFLEEVTSMGIRWHYQAPSWPSAGGIWEGAVKSLKYHLKRVIGEQTLTFEEYSTILSQLEGCLNSRPLCPMTEDPNDLEAITPAHFLACGPTLTIYETETDLRTRWHLTQKIYKDIWDRWSNEYLTLLAARSKWRKPQRNIKENDVVVIREDNIPPGKWALGRVVQLHPGSDGYVRVVTLKTKNGFMQRPIVKLSVLPVSDNQDIDQKPHKQPSTKQEKQLPSSISSSLTYKKKTYSFASLATALLLFFMTIISPALCSYNVTPLQNNSLYFDTISNMHLIRDDWRLVVYYDTRPYQEGNTTLSKYLMYLNDLCINIKEQSHCREIMTQMQHEFAELQYYNNVLMQQKCDTRSRRRRGLIDGVGYIANSLFGVLDERFAEKYEQDIKLIKDNQKHLASLWKNQTSVVAAEFNLLKRTEDIMNKHHKIINKKINQLVNAINPINEASVALQNISLTTEFLGTAMMANNLLNSLKNIQQTLLDTITNIYNGKFNFHLLTPDQIRQELNVIAGQLPKDLSLPVDNYDFSDIYNLLQVRTRMTYNYIIFEIKMPLISRDMYEILRPIPIPHLSGNLTQQTVIPIAEYVAISLRKDAFVPLSEKDFDSCLNRNSDIILCYLKKPIYHIQDDQSLCERLPNTRYCQSMISPCLNKWTELHKINTYFYYCCDRCQLKLLCEDQVTVVQLTAAGLFNVDQGCIIKSADFFVYSHKQEMTKLSISSKIPAPEISPINRIFNISLPNQLILNDETDNATHYRQLQEIKQQLNLMKSSEPIAESVSYHDVHHYVAIYVLFAIVAGGAAALAWWRCKRTPAAAAAAAGPVAPQPPARASVSAVKCCVSELSEVPKESARVSKQNKSTTPVLRSVFTIQDSSD
ncbi:hypothetical protein ABMA28_016761 [Loxostege sticticalis]|uniref:Endonuclease n=1 Tax=Loxostege sticticalis TaxID=481309 RepID=A0ABD0T5R9_LOXSC